MDKQQKQFTMSQIHEMRKKLLEEHGEKIIRGPDDELTKDEKIAKGMYMGLSNILHEKVPETKRLDRIYEFYVKRDVKSIFEFFIPFRMLKLKPKTSGGKLLLTIWLIIHIGIILYAIYGIGAYSLGSLGYLISGTSSSWPDGPLTTIVALLSIPLFLLVKIDTSQGIGLYLFSIFLLILFIISYYIIPLVITDVIFYRLYNIWSRSK